VRRGRLRDDVVPAFTRYVFTRVSDERWGELKEVPGVIGFVRDGDGRPAHVPDAVVEELLARSGGEILTPPEKPCGFQPGERVIVQGAGLIAGYAGIFKQARRVVPLFVPGGRSFVPACACRWAARRGRQGWPSRWSCLSLPCCQATP
jgi:Transcription termination factor nusG